MTTNDIATKGDIQKLGSELRAYIDDVRGPLLGRKFLYASEVKAILTPADGWSEQTWGRVRKQFPWRKFGTSDVVMLEDYEAVINRI